MSSNFDPPFVFGITGLTIVTFAYKRFYDFSFSLLFLILLLSILSVVSFSHSFYVRFMIFNIPSLLLFSILFFTQSQKIFGLKEKWFSEDEEEIENYKIKKINLFKTQFQNLSESALKRKLEEENLVEEAKVAIFEILNAKSN